MMNNKVTFPFNSHSLNLNIRLIFSQLEILSIDILENRSYE